MSEIPEDLVGLAAALSSGAISATTALEWWLAQLADADARTNCVAAWNRDAAMATAHELDRAFADNGPVGPLHGVPFTVKDWIDAAGMPCTGGYVECKDRKPGADATVVARLRSAGALLMAKTAVQVESSLFGKVLNPHDPERSPGGSSSGEAAAVGGRGSPLGVGSDSGGSIRLPAAWCGVAGLKPTFGRVPGTGHFPRVAERSDGRTQIGLLCGSVRGLIAAQRLIEGPDGVDGAMPPVPTCDADRVQIETLRVGFSFGEPTWQPDASVRSAVDWSLRAMEAGGATASGEVELHLDECFDVTKRYWRRESLSGEQAAKQLWDWDRYRRRILTSTRGVDAWLMPATATPAPIHRPMSEADYIFTLPASLTGAPAVVVPVPTSSTHLPVSLQVVAQPWRDDVALAIAAHLELAAVGGP